MKSLIKKDKSTGRAEYFSPEAVTVGLHVEWYWTDIECEENAKLDLWLEWIGAMLIRERDEREGDLILNPGDRCVIADDYCGL